MERDLKFSNGYIRQLKKGTIPIDRLISIASYLNMSVNDLLADGSAPLLEMKKAVTPEDDGLAKELSELDEFIQLYLSAPSWIQEQACSLLRAGAQSVGNLSDTDTKAE